LKIIEQPCLGNALGFAEIHIMSLDDPIRSDPIKSVDELLMDFGALFMDEEG
jgi:hypothetical protein